MPTVVISPFNVLNFPEGGGHFWVYMQYVQGLRELGCEVYWLESFRSAGDESADATKLFPFLARLKCFGLEGRTILYADGEPAGAAGLPPKYVAMNRDEAEEIFEHADLLL